MSRKIKFKVVETIDGVSRVLGIERISPIGTWEYQLTGKKNWNHGIITTGQEGYVEMQRLQYSGMNDKRNNEIYEGCAICTPYLSGTVVFDEGCFSFKIERFITNNHQGYDIGSMPPLCDFSTNQLEVE